MLEREAIPAAVAMSLGLGGSDRERDLRAWQLCELVVEQLDAYRPAALNPRVTAELAGLLGSLRNASQDPDTLRSIALTQAVAFGTYRVDVQNHEVREAAKLQTLVETLRGLYRLRDRSDKPAKIDRAARLIGDLLVEVWHCQDVPLEGDHRTWATRKTRDYRALPAAWRSL